MRDYLESSRVLTGGIDMIGNSLCEALSKQLEKILNKDLLEMIVRRVLDCRKEMKQEKRRKLESVISTHIEIKGFRSPLAAPPAILAKKVAELATYNRDVQKDMIDAWVESLPEVATVAKSYLSDCIAALKRAGKQSDVKDENQFLEDFVGPAAERLARKTGCGVGEARVMLYALTLTLLQDEEESAAQEEAACSEDEKPLPTEPGNSFWSKILNELKTFPPEAPEWDGLEQFIADLQALAAEKALERCGRLSFGEAVSQLLLQCADDLPFFGMEAAKLWTGDRVCPEEAAGLAEEVNALRKTLLRHRELRFAPTNSIVEMRQRRNELSELEKTAEEIFSRINRVLKPAPEVGSEAVTETAQARESGIGDITAPETKTPETNGDIDTLNEVLHEGFAEDSGVGTRSVPLETQPEALEVDKEVGSAGESNASKVELPPQDISEDSRWEKFFWDLLCADDLSGAYWLSRSLEKRGCRPPVPSWLVQAVQGARWLNMDSSSFVGDLLQIARKYLPGDTDVEELLGLAASLRPAVIAPASGMLGWLKTPRCCPTLNDIVQTVKEFAQLGKPLRRVDLLGVAGAQQCEALIKSIAENARQWLEEAQRRRTKLARATNVWIDLVSQHGELRAFLQPVADDRRERWAEVRSRAEQWLDRDFVERNIVEVDRSIVRRKVPPITGDPREQIIRWVRDACDLALRWCELVERDVEGRTKGRDWLAGRISALRTGVQAVVTEVQLAIDELMQDKGSPGRTAAASCLARSLEQLYTDLGLVEGLSAGSSTWNWLTDDAEEMDTAMARRLVLLPDIDLDDSGKPTEETEANIAVALWEAQASQRDLGSIFLQWLAKKDYRFVRVLLASIQDEDERAEFARRYEEELSGSKAALEEAVYRARDMVEQAVVDGILSNEERAAHLSNLENIDPRTTLNYPPQYEKLDSVRRSIVEARQRRLEELRGEWEHLRRRLVDHPGENDKKAEILVTVGRALEREDTRVVEECIAHLNELMDSGEFLNKNPFDLPPERDERDIFTFQRFIEASTRLCEVLEKQGLQPLQDAIGQGRSWGGLNFAKFPRGLQEETLAAIEAWRRLKQGTAGSPGNQTHIVAILRYLGFNIDPSMKTAITSQKKGEHWLHLQVAMSAGGRSPVPQFGSQQQGMYDVVCLWERPSVDTFAGWIRDLRLENKNILVLYLGRMSLRHRRVMRQMTSDRGLVVIVLDEVLFTFLTGERLERLSVFFRCALPFAAVNPYTPFRAGDVPPEMFFGRKEMARELQRAEGSCIVYGGRQLGKSALLRHVQREFHNPEREQYAHVEDIKLVGSPMSDQRPDAIWTKLRDIFKKFGLLSTRVTTERPEEIAKLIEDALHKRPHCRVLILFDEADDFLDADSENNFKVVDGLRILMANVQRRLKVVLAGLHNVQRFQGRGNQPLAHFGTPLCVGPLEPDAAQRLIREPLGALGYRFTDNSVVLSILSYTNYHPGLIQLFCQELLNRTNARPMGDPPYTISREDVEAIYRNEEVRKRICERFDWTLALDHRYQAIAWAMILDQAGTRDGFSQTYASGELLTLARQWWPQGFEGTETDQLRGLLDEMFGLGVLVRDSQGYYRLRSPNLVRLMEDVESRLLDLSYKEPEVKGFDPDSYHAPLNSPRCYSPLTYAQESNLNQQRIGVGLVFASEALGMSRLNEAFQRLIPSELSPVVKTNLRAIPPDLTEGTQLETWLERYLRDHDKYEHLVLYCLPRDDGSQEVDLVRTALQFTQRYRKRQRQWLRVIFVFDPRGTWRWLSLPENERLLLENQADAATHLRRWNLRAIRQRLAQQDKIHSEEVCQEILRVTGGWPYLLDELFERCGTQDDPRPWVLEIERELADPGTSLFGSFWASLGLEASESIEGVLKFILQEDKGVPQDLTEPKQLAELMHDETGLSLAECEVGVLYVKRMGFTETRDGALWVEPTVSQMLKKL